MNLKKLLPFENFVLTTQLPVEDVRQRLFDKIEPKNLAAAGSKSKPEKPYRGNLLGNTFSITRVINYRNSFLPEIKGVITGGYGKTLIQVKMRPAGFVLAFMGLWLGGVGSVCLAIIGVGILQFKQVLHGGFSPMALIPFGMFVFGLLLITFGFREEARRSKDFLKKLLEAQQTQETV